MHDDAVRKKIHFERRLFRSQSPGTKISLVRVPVTSLIRQARGLSILSIGQVGPEGTKVTLKA